jgi:hypothetical protein
MGSFLTSQVGEKAAIEGGENTVFNPQNLVARPKPVRNS